MNGIIFDIKRFAVHDGPGIRATVFLKGCPLACQWCHNPESMSPAICTVSKTVRIGEKVFTEDETVGRKVTTRELMKELMKEQVFMEESGGGVTFSGGEPLFQHGFLTEMLAACQAEGMHTAVDTCGFASWKVLEKVAQQTDLFLYDLKVMDSEKHKTFTGVPNELIHENLCRLLAAGKKVRIRIPLIPGITFTENNVSELIVFLQTLKYPLDGVDLLPYHSTASHKYDRFGIDNRLKEHKTVQKPELAGIKRRFEDAGFVVNIGG